MKKIKLMAAALMLCAAAFAGYTAYDKATMTDSEKMMLANIEALATGGDETKDVTCTPDKGDTCLVGSTPVSDYDEKDSWF